jgi:hypothetical protein
VGGELDDGHARRLLQIPSAVNGLRNASGQVRSASFPRVTAVPGFDFAAFFAAFDTERQNRGLGWYEFADELWQQSAQLNAECEDHPI